MNVGWRYGPVGGNRSVGRAFPHGRDLLDPARVAAAAGTSARLRDVHHYPGRMLCAVHELADGRLVALDGLPVDGPVPPGEVWPGLPARVRVFPDDPGLDAVPAVPASAVLSWIPGRRAVLAREDRIARFDPRVDPEAADRRHHLLRAAVGGRVPLPVPLGADPVRGVRWESRLAGDPVEPLLWLRLSPETLAGEIGAAAAALHAVPPGALGPLPDRGPEMLLQRLRGMVTRTVRRGLPGLAPGFERVVAELVRRRPRAAVPVTVHGDLHLANLLRTPEGMALLDVDEVGAGDAALDLAMAGSRLLLIALHRGAGLAEATSCAAALPARYAEAGGRPLEPSRYAWSVAACLLARQVKTAIRHLAPDLDGLCAALVAVAGRVLDAGAVDPGAVGPVTDGR